MCENVVKKGKKRSNLQIPRKIQQQKKRRKFKYSKQAMDTSSIILLGHSMNTISILIEWY